jgi:hypothetical protein
MRLDVSGRFFFALLLSLLVNLPAVIAKDSPEGARPSLTVDQALVWLPPNTETIMVVQGPFELQPLEPADQKEGESPPLAKILQFFACGPVAHPEKGTYLQSLKGSIVAFVLEGARGFRSPKSLGMMPYDGCHIIVFKDDLKTAKDDFIEGLRTQNPKEEQISGQKTFVIQQRLEEDEWKNYFAFPRPNVLLAATDRSYLEEVLKRMGMKEKPKDRALPENLSEWKHVDRTAKFWGIRHYDKANAKNDPSSPLTNEQRAANNPDLSAVGLVFAYNGGKKDLATVKYLSASENAARIAARAWTRGQDGMKPQIREKIKGVVEISFELNGEETKQGFLLLFLAALGHGIFI